MFMSPLRHASNRITACVFCLGSAVAVVTTSQVAETMAAEAIAVDPLAWPAITAETKPWTRWWWMGNSVSEQELSLAMASYSDAGIGGLEITPIYGVQGEEQRFVEYLSPRWVELLTFTLAEADKHDLLVDMATGTGWPFGGQWIDAADACKYLTFQKYSPRKNAPIDGPIRMLQRPMARAVGRRIAIADLVEPIRENKDLQGLALEQIRFEKPMPLQALIATDDQGHIVDLTDRVAEDGKLDWVPDSDAWTLVAGFQGWHGKMVERAGPGGEGNVIDHFSQAALEAYLSRFDEAFATSDITSLRAFFNDSYEVDDASGNADWTPDFFAQFQKRRRYDLRHYLHHLAAEDDSDPMKWRVMCDYRETVSDLLLDEFTTPWRQWAASKQAIIRNQAHGSPANILDLYAASDIPETEGTDVIQFMTASSAAHVAGHRLASAEAATWMNEHFRGTLAETKQSVDRYFLGGVNHICYHGTTYSPTTETWPGWLFYAAVNYAPSNSFWEHFHQLNAYVARCQSFLQADQPDNDILLYTPIHDLWSAPGRKTLHHFDGSLKDTSARPVAETLLAGGHAFDFVSDKQILTLSADAAAITAPSGARYRTIVVPAAKLIPLDTWNHIVLLAMSGANVIFCDSLPDDVPGVFELRERQHRLKASQSGLAFIDDGHGTSVAKVGRGQLIVTDNALRALISLGIAAESLVARQLQFARRRHDHGHTYFIVNSANTPFDDWVTVSRPAADAVLFDCMQHTTGLADTKTNSDGSMNIRLQLMPNESVVIHTWDKPLAGAPRHRYDQLHSVAIASSITLPGPWQLQFIKGGPALPPRQSIDTLRSWTDLEVAGAADFSGLATYTTTFEQPPGTAEAWWLDLGTVHESARVTLNGHEVGTSIIAPHRFRITRDMLVDGPNTLEIEVANLMTNRIIALDRTGVKWKKFYNVNFAAKERGNRGPDGLFSATQWSPLPSGLLGPVRLIPLAAIDTHVSDTSSRPTKSTSKSKSLTFEIRANTRPLPAQHLMSIRLPANYDRDAAYRVVRTDSGSVIDAQVSHVSNQADSSETPSTVYWLLDEAIDRSQVRKYRLESTDQATSSHVFCEERNGTLRIRNDDQPVLVYHCDIAPVPADIDPVFARSGFIHPLYSPGGRVLTDDYPPDHAHQHGVFTAWVNTTYDGKKVDFWNQKDRTGNVRHVSVDNLVSGPVFAEFTVTLDHVQLQDDNPPNTILKEQWTVRAYHRSDPLVVDLESTQVCVAEKPLQLNEYVYGGFGFRGHRQWGKDPSFGFMTSQGKHRTDGNHTRPNWLITHGNVDGSPAYVVAMGHPQNYRYPQPVRLHPSMPYFSLAPPVLGPFQLQPGVPYASRFRLVTFDGPPDEMDAENAWLEYAIP
ncbi:MAG: PmoA family protein, partial [Planctomycetales bacterium]|nr:PmoA family protein [Planctomycetales bacterium]